MYTQSQIDPLASFLNSAGESARGTIINLQRKSMVIEVYNPYSILQINEVLNDVTVRFGDTAAYQGRAMVSGLVNTGSTAVASVTLMDEWREPGNAAVAPGAVEAAAQSFVQDWEQRFRIRHDYQVAVNEARSYLSDVARWLDQVDISEAIPRVDGRLRTDVFYELATPLIGKMKFLFDRLNHEASLVEEEQSAAHRSHVQSALHPLLLRAPFVHRAFTKPLGYAGDYQMVNQILGDPCQGPSTYFQVVNTAFLQTAVTVAHRNRIDLLLDFLKRMANAAKLAKRPFRILNIGCGPAAEIQRFLQSYPEPELLSFELVDFSAEALAWTREKLNSIVGQIGKPVAINYVQDSVHQMLRRRFDSASGEMREFDAVYCAGLFDYLSDKVCSRLTAHFAARVHNGGTLLITNVHSSNPEKFTMAHILEWHLIYRDEAQMMAILPGQCDKTRFYADKTNVNIFAEATILHRQEV